MARKTTATVNITLRMREGLRRQIETAAKKEDRSLNEEMVARLEESFKREKADEILAESKRIIANIHGLMNDLRKSYPGIGGDK